MDEKENDGVNLQQQQQQQQLLLLLPPAARTSPGV